jgi:hypothetical protein
MAAAAYVAGYMDTHGARGAIVGMTSQTVGLPRIPQAFNVADWNTARTRINAAGTGANVVAQTGWGFFYGLPDVSTVLGAAFNVSEAVLLGGKKNGRHFLPNPRAAAIGTTGGFTTGSTSNITALWTAGIGFFLGGAIQPVVISGLGVGTLITSITVRSRVSFLRTRSR